MSDVTGPEGDVDMRFPVQLDNPSEQTVTVNWATTEDGTAVADTDYTTSSGTLTFAPGEHYKEIAVPLKNDTEVETDETIHIQLTGPVNAGCATVGGDDRCHAIGTIQDSSPDPDLTVAGPGTLDEDAGNAVFTVSLFHPTTGKATHSNSMITVDYATSDGSGDSDDKDAVAGQDYTETTGKLSIAAGQTTAAISVPITDDERYDHRVEHLTLTLSNPQNAAFQKAEGQPDKPDSISATAAIRDNDPRPRITVSDGEITEPAAGSPDAELSFTLTIDRMSDQNARVRVVTSDGTAKAGLDYEQLTSGNGANLYETEIITPGDTEQKVKVKADTLDEPDETFTVTLTDPNNHVVVDGAGAGTGTIKDATDPPMLHPFTTSFEGQEGGNDPEMVLILYPRTDDVADLDDAVFAGGLPSGKTVSFDYRVLDGDGANPSATMSRDFGPVSGTAVLQPGTPSSGSRSR